jgi:hypothetical protein
MFPLNTIIAWSINIIMNKRYDNNNITIASRAYFLKNTTGEGQNYQGKRTAQKISTHYYQMRRKISYKAHQKQPWW